MRCRFKISLPGILEVTRRDGYAVAPLQIVPQMEDVSPPLIQHLPPCGNGRQHIVIRIHLNQSLEELRCHERRDVIVHHAGVEGDWLLQGEAQGIRWSQLLRSPSR